MARGAEECVIHSWNGFDLELVGRWKFESGNNECTTASSVAEEWNNSNLFDFKVVKLKITDKTSWMGAVAEAESYGLLQ